MESRLTLLGMYMDLGRSNANWHLLFITFFNIKSVGMHGAQFDSTGHVYRLRAVNHGRCDVSILSYKERMGRVRRRPTQDMHSGIELQSAKMLPDCFILKRERVLIKV